MWSTQPQKNGNNCRLKPIYQKHSYYMALIRMKAHGMSMMKTMTATCLFLTCPLLPVTPEKKWFMKRLRLPLLLQISRWLRLTKNRYRCWAFFRKAKSATSIRNIKIAPSYRYCIRFRSVTWPTCAISTKPAKPTKINFNATCATKNFTD